MGTDNLQDDLDQRAQRGQRQEQRPRCNIPAGVCLYVLRTFDLFEVI